MAITEDIRKTLTDPTPLYAAAGVIDKIREEAPEAIAAVREADPKDLQTKISQQAKDAQAKVSQQAKEAQAKVSETLGNLDNDLRKLREQTQHYALTGVGLVAEYAVKARETYDELAERGRGAVKTWRGEEPEAGTTVTVAREPVKVAEPPAGKQEDGESKAGAAKAEAKPSQTAKKTTASSSSSSARKTTAAKKTAPKSDQPGQSGA
jgi:hypothetical protein